MPLEQLKTIKMDVRSYGEGPPLIGIMGLGANLDYWGDDLIKAISKHRRFIILDNRGVGETEKGKEEISIARMAEDVKELLDVLHIKQADIMGVSMGGMIAQQLTFDHPERVRKLILCCTSAEPRHTLAPTLPTKLMHLSRKALMTDILFPKWYQKAEPERMNHFIDRALARPVDRDVFFKQIGSCLGFHGLDKLQKIKTPSLVLYGDSDDLIDPKASVEIIKVTPGVESEMFPGGGHGFFLQYTQAIIERIDKFLGEEKAP